MKTLQSRISVLFASLVLLCFHSPASGQLSGYDSIEAFPGLNFANPLGVATPPGETNRLFVLEQSGIIVVITNLASPTRTVFMNISGRVDAGGELGLLGLAFHPNYQSNGFFYVFYTGSATNGGSGLHDILSRYQVSASNSNQGDPDSELRLIAQLDSQGNHNGGDIHFGSDGYLYVSLGDEGGGNDSEDNSQRIDKDFYSGIIRIDVDKHPGNFAPNSHPAGTPNYSVPADNPFVGATSFNGSTVNPANVRTEFWAVGLRNPWRWSFDPQTGIAYCGDVGQGSREEIDIIKKGGNYGWAYREGDIAGPKSPPPGFVNRIDPIFDYDRNLGNCVIGGVVYRGSRFPGLFGYYVFADIGSGRVWAMKYDGTNATAPEVLFYETGISAFGYDPSNGDVLCANLNSSSLHRIISTVPPGSLQVTIEPAGAVTAGARWRVDGGAFQTSGATVDGLAPGNHSVAFRSIPGWIAPGNLVVSIDSDTTTTTNATYISNDTTKPTVTILSPRSGQRVSNDVFTATGKASDNALVTEVRVQLNGNDWTLASGTTNWSADLSLSPGFNTLRAYSVDGNGRNSPTNSVTFFYVVSVPLTVQVVGSGSVVPNLNGRLLEIGKTYIMTARAARGFGFVKWTGSVQTNRARLTFVMASNLTFTANFVDVQKPLVIVTYPPVNKKVTNALLSVAGKARDNVGVDSVSYQLNGADWNPATTTNSWTNWSGSGLMPNSGRNLLQARAADAAGNISRTNRVNFFYVVVPSADWAPDTLSGLTAQVVPDADSPVEISFDAFSFSQTGDDTNEDFSVGNFSYTKTSTNTAELTWFNTAPPTRTNDSANSMSLVFTNHYSGVFTNDDGAGAIRFFIATNFMPTTLAGRRIVAMGNHGSRTITFQSNGTFTLTPALNGIDLSSAGNFTFQRCSPIGAMLVLSFTGTNAGTMSYVQLNFGSTRAGSYLATTFDGSGNPTDFDPGAFGLR